MSEQYDRNDHDYEPAGNDRYATPGPTATAVQDEPVREADAWGLPPTAAQAGGGGWGPWGEPRTWAPPPPNPSRRHPLRSLAVAAMTLALVAAGAGVGFVLGHRTVTTTATSSPPGAVAGSASAGSSGGSGSLNASQIASKVDEGVVDINTVLGYEDGEAAGTGIVLTSSGEILTNNHVVEGATSISVTDVANGQTYSATVVGTDASQDIAVLQLKGASGLHTISLGNSSTLAVGDAVVAVGNAGGVGGTPSYSSGQVSALDQSITASDEVSGSSEQLSGLIESTATLEPGDSGGPLVDSAGMVVGIDTAASSGFQFQSGSTQNYSIPINTAISIANQIEARNASSTIHIGATAFLGVEVESASALGASSGASVVLVEPGSPAEQAGLVAGDVIDSLAGQSVGSPGDLTNIMEEHHPGDTVELGWIDTSGQQQTATVTLTTGPTG